MRNWFLVCWVLLIIEKESMPSNSILIIDFGSQYTQLIARRIREIGVYCEMLFTFSLFE